MNAGDGAESSSRRGLGMVALALGGSALALVVVLADAARRRSRIDGASAHEVVALVGFPDLALSSTARWLRHPSQVEPAAAVTDEPAGLDVEPAGMLISPPFGRGRNASVEP